MDNYSKRALFYDVEYDTQEDFLFLEEILKGEKKNILEIPCGSGRTLSLHKNYQNIITFADINSAMISQLKKKITGLPEKRRFESVLADITNFNLQKQFDIILILKEAFQLLAPTKAVKALKCLKRHLSSKGSIYIDILDLENAHRLKSYLLPEYLDKVSKSKRIKIDNNSYAVKSIDYNGENLSILYHYKIFENEILFDEFKSQIELHNWKKEELEDIFQSVGLFIEDIFSDYQKNPFRPMSPRIIYELKL